MMKPRVCVLRTDGTNCDEETAHAFRMGGAEPWLVHVNQLRANDLRLRDFQILAIPGGFSYGDDIASGKVLAVELMSYLRDQLMEFLAKPHTLILGVCNGFQVLVRLGLLPYRQVGTMRVTLAHNARERFECRWVRLRTEKSPCVFLPKAFEGTEFELPVAHGEGQLYAEQSELQALEDRHLVALRYISEDGIPTQAYPANPNGSVHAIAGITDPSGQVFGAMPHFERYVMRTQHPNWRRYSDRNTPPPGRIIFKSAVDFIKRA